MQLIGITNGTEYYHAHGVHQNIAYCITEETPGKFLLEAERIVTGLGITTHPVAFFDASFKGVHSNIF